MIFFALGDQFFYFWNKILRFLFTFGGLQGGLAPADVGVDAVHVLGDGRDLEQQADLERIAPKS